MAEEAGDDDQEGNKEEGAEEKAKAPAGNETQRDSANRESVDETAPAANKKTLKGTA